jgi:hypothetical protein
MTTHRYLDHIRLLIRDDQPRAAPMLTGQWAAQSNSAKLCPRSVIVIRDWSRQHTHLSRRAQCRTLAPIFRVGESTIYDILARVSWSKVKEQ